MPRYKIETQVKVWIHNRLRRQKLGLMTDVPEVGS